MAIIISILALLATFYQAYLQRVHNEKSLKPLGQIVLEDRNKLISVHVRNNGLGPLIIDKLTYDKDNIIHASLEECLDLAPTSYAGASIHDSVTRVILPDSSLLVFETRFDEQEDETVIAHVRSQLSPIILKVEFHDIYDNKMTIERDFQWFARYMLEKPIER